MSKHNSAVYNVIVDFLSTCIWSLYLTTTLAPPFYPYNRICWQADFNRNSTTFFQSTLILDAIFHCFLSQNREWLEKQCDSLPYSILTTKQPFLDGTGPLVCSLTGHTDVINSIDITQDNSVVISCKFIYLVRIVHIQITPIEATIH